MTNEQLNYIYGLFLADGWLIKRKGIVTGISMEVHIKDKDIIQKLCKLIPNSSFYYRERDTNFKHQYKSICFQYSRKDLPLLLIQMGFPTENKDINAKPPIIDYNDYAFWRGVIDGDGSLGLKKNGTPFISLTTNSDALKEAFCLFLHNITGKYYNPHRNKRDNIYNIGCNGQSAKLVIGELYNSIIDTSIFLNRKYIKMKEVLNI